MSVMLDTIVLISALLFPSKKIEDIDVPIAGDKDFADVVVERPRI